MQTTFFKKEGDVFSAKVGGNFVEISESQLGESVGKIVTELVHETFTAEKIAEIEGNAEHQDFSAYWALVNEKHSLVHSDLTTLQQAIGASA
jgi:hypothetical protein